MATPTPRPKPHGQARPRPRRLTKPLPGLGMTVPDKGQWAEWVMIELSLAAQEN